MENNVPTEQSSVALWRQARAAGMTRRNFVLMLTTGGAAAVLTACTSKLVTTTPSPSPTSAAPTTTAAAQRQINKPTPEQFFIAQGATNSEMRFEVMADRTYLMPDSLFFVRSHTSSPFIDPKTWTLSIEGPGVSKPFQLTYDELLKQPSTTITRFVECAGNGRSFFDSQLGKPAQGGQWHLGAYGVAEWTGVRLKDLLDRAGISSSAVDVMPVGLDSTKVERPMPVAKAMEEDVIVAYLMNGDILPIDHGFPARVVAPGWVGVNSVKWVGKIVVSTEPIKTEKNTTTYVLIGPDYQPASPALGPAVSTQVMKSAMCLPWPAALKAGNQKIVGYAWSPFGTIAKVEVSVDGGQTFAAATLTGPNIEKAGSRWEFAFNATPSMKSMMTRATDNKGNVQPGVSEQKWNQLGYLYGAVVPHPVTVGS